MQPKILRICPRSSGTIEKQERNYNPWGITVIAFLEAQQKRKFNQIIESIEELGYYFRRAQNLHFTLLPLFDDKRKQNPEYLKLTCDTINKFFSHQYHKIGPLNIDCNIVRPGSMYDKDKKRNSYVKLWYSNCHGQPRKLIHSEVHKIRR